jgi:hypothetical protein
MPLTLGTLGALIGDLLFAQAHDLHATILHLLDLDPMQLTYFHKGRPERPTLNEGHPCRKLWEA